MKRAALLFGLILLSTAALRADDLASYEASPDLLQTQGYVVFFDAQGPLSYATATQLPENAVSLGVVHGQACQQGLSVPFTAKVTTASGRVDGVLGDSGFVKALARVRKENPTLTGVYNVQVDLHEIQILTIYTRLCTEITARGYKLEPLGSIAKT